MKLAKAREIMELNLKEAGKKMPPDVKDALGLGIEAMKRLQLLRKDFDLLRSEALPGETEE